jgi:hypothetical protein
MPPGANLQRQHRKLSDLATELVALSMRPFCDAAEVRRKLAEFSGTLRIHAAMEEEGLYPALLASEDAHLRNTAERLHGELAGLYRKWDDFLAHWPDAEAIATRTTRFRFELMIVLSALRNRMRREDDELYPLVAERAAG